MPVTLVTGAVANGSAVYVPAPDGAAGVAVEGEVCDVPDELELATSVSPACVVVVDWFRFA